MSHFYGTLNGQAGEATRCGSKSSGLVAVAASWNGAIRVELWVGADGQDRFSVEQISWEGNGNSEVLIHGAPIGVSAKDL